MTEPWMKTAARGYGGAHQKLRAQVKKIVDSGAAMCWRCGLGIQPGEPFDLGHDDQDRSVYRGPEHRRCNRATSTRRTNTSRGRSLSAPRQGRARRCEVCGSEYRASTREQRTCSRTCGWELRRRNAPPPVIKPVQRSPKVTESRDCSECGSAFELTHPRRLTCGQDCAKARNGRQVLEYYHTNPEYRAATIERAKQRYQKKRWAL